jgi:hypothetical protein
MAKGMDLNKEADELTRAGNAALYKAQKEQAAVSEAMKDPETKKAVMDFIFSKDPDAVSPLDSIRKGK